MKQSNLSKKLKAGKGDERMTNQITCASCGKIISHFYTIWRKNTKNVRGKNTWKKRDGKLVCSDCLVKYLNEYEVIHEWVEEISPISYWHEFAEVMYYKAIMHLKKHPEDRFDAWNDPSKDDEFWFKRLDEELLELKNAKDKKEQVDELLDVANICLFLWQRRGMGR